MSDDSGLYLGRLVDPSTGKTSQETLLLAADDLTTHGLIVGMTGSGKTALGIVLIEELLKKGIPVLAIDPKGDLGNLLLAFPSLSSDQFGPWVDTSTGATPEGEAKRWSEGLAGWGLGPADVRALAACRDAAIYTPGSTAGLQVDLLGSLTPEAGGVATEEGRDLVTSFVSALLGLVGVEADPVKSREHVLLSKCAEALFGQGRPATLEALIQTAAEPPFAAVGALSLETFFPAKDRQALVLSLNNLLASPSTAAFRTGAPLDVEAMLGRKGGGKPRLSIVTISHLSDPERVFVVATLLSQVRSWLRRQPGSPSLKAVLYIDEIFGFFPPSAEPPTKRPLLGLLKQARAFGTGVVLATQNPVDLDYKGLANCGAWWVGTLQAERDRARLTEGLASAGGSGAALGLLDKTRKRVFLLHDVHRKEPVLVESRWAMSYLRGPMTKDEIGSLTSGSSVAQASEAARAVSAAAPPPAAGSGAPIVPAPWTSRWADRRHGEMASAYLYVRYAVRYRQAKASSDEVSGLRLYPLDVVAPADVMEGEPLAEVTELSDAAPKSPLRYSPLPAWLGPTTVKDVEKSVRERLPDKLGEKLLLDPVTGKLSTPGETGEEFAARVAASGVEAPAALAERLEKKRRELAAAEEAEKGRSMETLATGLGAAADLLGGLLGKRKTLRVGKVTSVLSKHRMESTAESKVAELKAEIAELEAKVGAPDPARFQVVDVVPAKAQVDLVGIGVAWVS